MTEYHVKRTRDGDWFCLEVNPSPAYTYYQEHTGQPIAEAIVDHLVDGDRQQHGSDP